MTLPYHPTQLEDAAWAKRYPEAAIAATDPAILCRYLIADAAVNFYRHQFDAVVEFDYWRHARAFNPIAMAL